MKDSLRAMPNLVQLHMQNREWSECILGLLCNVGIAAGAVVDDNSCCWPSARITYRFDIIWIKNVIIVRRQKLGFLFLGTVNLWENINPIIEQKLPNLFRQCHLWRLVLWQNWTNSATSSGQIPSQYIGQHDTFSKKLYSWQLLIAPDSPIFALKDLWTFQTSNVIAGIFWLTNMFSVFTKLSFSHVFPKEHSIFI